MSDKLMTPRFWLALVILVVAVLLVGCRPASDVAGCPRLLAMAQTEREVLLVVAAQPLCADALNDSLLAPLAPAQETER